MGIINLKTDLTNLGWGKDQPGGGDSGLPYIKTSTPEKSNAIERIALESALHSSDYPIRGGIYSIRAAAEDAIRIRKFLTDFPKGSNFTLKQVGLQKSNPLIEVGKTGGRINTRTYNLNSNILFSILNAGTGKYYPRAGATPFTLLDDNGKYASIVGKKDVNNNKLVNLYKTKILQEEGNSFLLEELGISPNRFEILNYTGGPNSFYGDGETIHFRATDYQGVPINTNYIPTNNYIKLASPLTENVLGISNYLRVLNPRLTDDQLNDLKGIYKVEDEVRDEISNDLKTKSTFQTSFNTLPYSKIISKTRYNIGENIQDFRSEIEPSGSINSRDYSYFKMESRIGIGSPGARPRELRINSNQIFKEGQDLKQLTPIYYRRQDIPIEQDPNTRDLIKFAFETIDNNNLNYTYRTHFRAYMKGFSDSNTADWDGKRYTGRGDNMYSYNGFDRSINFNFTVLAHSKQEMKPLWQKLNYLNSTLTPDYNQSTGFMRGNIHRLTIGEYLYRMPGIIKSLNYSINDQYSWEIKIDEPEKGGDNDMMELPQAIDVTVSFIPIYNELPRTITRDNFNISSLISKEVGDTENYIRNKNPFLPYDDMIKLVSNIKF